MRSLIKFAPLKVKPSPPSFDYQPWKKEEKEVHPLNALTPVGLEML